MRKGDIPPPVPERVANLRIREDRAIQEFRQNSEKMHRATSEDAHTKACLTVAEVFPQSERKAGPDGHLKTSQRISAASSSTTWVPSTRRENFGRLRILISRFNVTNDPHLSLLTEFWRNNYARVILTAEADSLATDARVAS